MKGLHRVGLAVTGALAAVGMNWSALPPAAQAQTCAWTQVASPSPGTGSNGLSGVAAVSASDVWAVGSARTGSGATQTLTEHWNGTGWAQVASASPGTGSNGLSGVAAVSTSDVWAVGSTRTGSGATQTLIEHWDGTSWTQVASPSPGTLSNGLNGVAAISASDVWAVGHTNSSSNQTLIEHWNGTSWTQVASPSPVTGFNGLNAVAAVSASDVWAVGESGTASNVFTTLIEHWDGTSWTQVASPSTGSGGIFLRGVAAVSTSDVWAVGESGGGVAPVTLIEHWDGASWTQVASPAPGTGSGLSGVAAVSASDLWAVGFGQSGSTGAQTLTEHWNASGWSVVASPSPATTFNSLSGVAALSASDVWAVGASQTGNAAEQTLIEHFGCVAPSPSGGAAPAGLPKAGRPVGPQPAVAWDSLLAVLGLLGVTGYALRRAPNPRSLMRRL